MTKYIVVDADIADVDAGGKSWKTSEFHCFLRKKSVADFGKNAYNIAIALGDSYFCKRMFDFE